MPSTRCWILPVEMANPSHRAVTVSQSLTELDPDLVETLRLSWTRSSAYLVVGTQVSDNARCDPRPEIGCYVGSREVGCVELTRPEGEV